ncbi:MAG: histidine kinase [Actinomycetota bacterium]|nr:histidine kinase [Actinomycetota bacterium]
MSSAPLAHRPRLGMPRGKRLAIWLLTPGTLVLVVALLLLDHAARERGLRDAVQLTWSSAGFIVAMMSAVCVGALVSLRRPEHPVGWLIWVFGLTILLAGVEDSYAAIAFLRPSVDLPGANAAAALTNADFVPWLTLLTLILTLTPTGKLPPRWGRAFAAVCIGAGVVFFVARLLRPGRLQFPLQNVDNPVGVDRDLAVVMGAAVGVAAIVVNLGLLASAFFLLRRFTTSTSEDRQQLKWVAVAAVGIAFAAIVPALANTQLPASTASVVKSVVVGGAFSLVMLGIAASVLRYRLYAVDRVLSRGTAYLLISIVVALVFVAVTLGLSQITSSRNSSSLRVGVSTLTAAAVAGLLRNRIQQAVDRRFRRRHFEATAVMRAFLATAPTGSEEAEQALRDATGDESIRVGYPKAESDSELVEANGSPFQPSMEPQRASISLTRGTERVAVVEHDLEASPAELVRQCAQMALAQLDNIRLRAELRTRLGEAEHSRARLAIAASVERHRIERNLHDGAQQRLVAVMVALRTTSLRAARGVPVAEDLQVAIDDLRTAVQELRELANGLVPALLVRDGLEAALQDLAGRCPVPVTVDAQLPRLPEAVEETAYYVAAEGLANAMKHAAASHIAITASINAAHLALNVSDDGIGGSNPGGPGLLGLADRVHVLFGELHVASSATGGTLLRLELPCA